jgi:hypothetical protein
MGAAGRIKTKRAHGTGLTLPPVPYPFRATTRATDRAIPASITVPS